MNNMLVGTNGRHFSTSWLRSSAVAVVGLALGMALWMTTASVAQAQTTPARQIEANLPNGQTVANASKADLLSAICAAIKKNPRSAPQIARVAATARPDLAKDILRTAFRCAGNDCRLLGRILRETIAAVPDQASSLTNLAVELAPDCAGSFQTGGGGGDEGEGGFGNVPVNQNPPPGSIGGGGGQGNVVAVCFQGVTRFFSPEGAQDFINGHPGSTLGACVVTPVKNN